MPIESEWVLFLDADEWPSEELKSQISIALASEPKCNGFYMKRKFMWFGKWVKRGYYPVWILRLFRNGTAQCEDRAVNEHIIVEGQAEQLQGDLIHEDRNGLNFWLQKHIRYAQLEAIELRVRRASRPQRGSQSSKRRWLRENLYNRLPRFSRCIVFFVYRTIVCGGILDGPIVITYHLLHSLWYRFVIDLLDLEQELTTRSGVYPK